MIVPTGIDKGTALKHVTQSLNLDLGQAIAVGDGENDLAMFKVAGFSVAPENAIDEIKAQANVVSGKTAGAAVEEFVNEYLFSDLPSLADYGQFAL